MLKPFFVALACVGVASLSLSQENLEKPFGSQAGKELYQKFSHTLTDAKSLKANFLIQWIGNSPQQGSIELSKPGVGTIKTQSSEFAFSGERVTVTNLKTGNRVSVAQNHQQLTKLFDNPEIAVWFPFFDATAFMSSFQIDTAGYKQRNDEVMRTISIQKDQSVTLREHCYKIYVDPQTDRIRQMEYRELNSKGDKTLVMVVRDLKIE